MTSSRGREHPWGVPLWVIALCIPIDVAGFVMLAWAHGF